MSTDGFAKDFFRFLFHRIDATTIATTIIIKIPITIAGNVYLW